ncbi:response regulator transcription factor [Granulicella sp. S190]|uniref:response regulator n=1 Tax=Granulicella sp. S190 TaxID=1747226 RepID=UPI00131C3C82|nr:response regulator transcription factor [Granulicella sp. S190]
MNPSVRILIVDDHTLFRESLSRLLEADTECTVVGTSATVEDALALVAEEKIDLILLDYDLGVEPGTRLLSELRKASFQGHVLMVTAGMSDETMLRALDSGASGLFLKSSPLAELTLAIRRVMMGEIWVDSGMVKSLIAGARQYNAEAIQGTLTIRERKVLRCVFEGLSNKEIGQQLNISEGSVKASLQQLFARTGVRTRSQLVRIAVEQHSNDWLNDE